MIQFPGRQLKGRSVIETLSDEQPKRIPTVFAPFYSGYRFEMEGRETPPGTTLHLSNMTILVPNATYENLGTSGIMDYFEFGDSARFCITNRCDDKSTATCRLHLAREISTCMRFGISSSLSCLWGPLEALCSNAV